MKAGSVTIASAALAALLLRRCGYSWEKLSGSVFRTDKELLAWMAAGNLRIDVDEAFPLAEAATALHRNVESGVRGKLVLKP